MNDYEYEIQGAPVVYTNCPPPPNNPLNRPVVRFVKPIITLVVFIIVNILLGVFYSKSDDLIDCTWMQPETIGVIVWILIDVVYIALISKRAIIWLVHLYQKYASDEVRLKCVFEPSCSEYMIASVEKYGTIKGVSKGINRLLRCHPPNGGRDEP